MRMLEIIASIAVAMFAAWAGFIHLELRAMKDKLSKVPERREVHNEIETRQESIKVLQQELKEACKRIDSKLDRVIDKLL